MSSDVTRPRPLLTADELASLVTHELRNPLNAISGWLHLLSADPARRPDAAERALAGMRRALDQQVAQIDTLGRVLRLTMPHGTPVACALLDAAELLTDGIGSLLPAARAAGREIVLTVPAGTATPWVFAERAALDGALQALARYALRHGTPSAPLCIDLSADPGGDGVVVCLRIDEGTGTGRSIWSVFAADGRTRLPLELLHAALEIESVGARIGPRGDGRIGDALQVRFPPHDGPDGVPHRRDART